MMAHSHICEGSGVPSSTTRGEVLKSGKRKLMCVSLQGSDRALLYLKVPKLRPVVLLIRAVLRWKRVWNIGGMLLTRDTEYLQKHLFLHHKSDTDWLEIEPIPQRWETSSTIRLNHGTTFKPKSILSIVTKFSSHLTVKTLHLYLRSFREIPVV
jgi:hypothetical protein